MNTLDKKYTDLLQDILDNGVHKGDRTGTGTLSVFGRQIRHNMSEGFPLITSKKMYFKGIVTELLWFLRGDTNIKFLIDNNCHIWDGDAYQSYCKRYWELGEIAKIEYGSSYYNHETNEYEFETYSKEEFVNYIKTNDAFAKKWGSLGKIYGYQWRNWGSEEILVEKSFGDDEGFGYKRKVKVQTKGVDQISDLIEQLKENPDSRRLLVSAWNPADLPHQVLPPCHYGFQVYTRELSDKERIEWMGGKIQEKYPALVEQQIKHCDEHNVPKRAISLMWNQRSVDTFLGLPFNIASYGLLLEIIAKVVNMVPDELIGNLGDTHLYSNHIEQATEQIGRELTYKERYDIWFENNYQTGMEYNLDVEQDFNNNVGEDYMTVPPYRTREPFPLPKLKINSGNDNWHLLGINEIINSLDPDITFKIENYQSHPTIKAPLSN
jgi:thymidylate synthase